MILLENDWRFVDYALTDLADLKQGRVTTIPKKAKVAFSLPVRSVKGLFEKWNPQRRRNIGTTAAPTPRATPSLCTLEGKEKLVCAVIEFPAVDGGVNDNVNVYALNEHKSRFHARVPSCVVSLASAFCNSSSHLFLSSTPIPAACAGV
jgi:hypothetical protein